MGAGTRVVVKDTDLVSTVVYASHYYGSCPAWIERAARERLGDLYLLLHPDVPWVADGLQRDRPADRARLHQLFRERLRPRRARRRHHRRLARPPRAGRRGDRASALGSDPGLTPLHRGQSRV